MEIIKRGHAVWKKVTKYQATCWCCNTEFRFSPEEINHTAYGPSVNCPLCGFSISYETFRPVEFEITKEIK